MFVRIEVINVSADNLARTIIASWIRQLELVACVALGRSFSDHASAGDSCQPTTVRVPV